VSRDEGLPEVRRAVSYVPGHRRAHRRGHRGRIQEDHGRARSTPHVLRMTHATPRIAVSVAFAAMIVPRSPDASLDI